MNFNNNNNNNNFNNGGNFNQPQQPQAPTMFSVEDYVNKYDEATELVTGRELIPEGWSTAKILSLGQSKNKKGHNFRIGNNDEDAINLYIAYDKVKNFIVLNKCIEVAFNGNINENDYIGKSLDIHVKHVERKAYKIVGRENAVYDLDKFIAEVQKDTFSDNVTAFLQQNNAKKMTDDLFLAWIPGNEISTFKQGEITKINKAGVSAKVNQQPQNNQPQQPQMQNNQPLNPNDFANRDEYNRAVQEQMNQLTGQEMNNFNIDDSVPF